MYLYILEYILGLSNCCVAYVYIILYEYTHVYINEYIYLKKKCPCTKLLHWLAMIEYKITNCDIYRSRTQRNPLPVANFVLNSITYLSKT